jgi:hypothetical protein
MKLLIMHTIYPTFSNKVKFKHQDNEQLASETFCGDLSETSRPYLYTGFDIYLVWEPYHYRKHVLCQVLRDLSNVKSRALDKDIFVECCSWQSGTLGICTLYREPNTRHKITLECPTLDTLGHSVKHHQ